MNSLTHAIEDLVLAAGVLALGKRKKGLKNQIKNPFNIFLKKNPLEKLLNHPDIKV